MQDTTASKAHLPAQLGDAKRIPPLLACPPARLLLALGRDLDGGLLGNLAVLECGGYGHHLETSCGYRLLLNPRQLG